MRLKTLVVMVLCVLSLNIGTALGSPKKHRVAPAKVATVARETTAQAMSMIVMDPNTATILFEENAYAERPIASITKVMTATVFLDSNPDLTELVTVTRADTVRASTTHLQANDRVTVDDLLHLMLIASDNVAARILARISGPDFVARMNDKAEALGLYNTRYVEPSGLAAQNISTAYDIARLITLASTDTYVSGIMRTAEYSVKTARRVIKFHTTDHLLRRASVEVMAAKTGFIGPSGFCFASVLRQPGDIAYTVVVLGARSNADRFDKANDLLRLISDVNTPSYRVGLVMRARMDGGFCGTFPSAVSVAGIDFIKRHEGFYPAAYHDAKGYAIGYGMHRWLGRPVTRSYPGYVTRGMADLEFARQLPLYQDVVERSVCAELNQANYDALVSVAYNLGRVNDLIIQRLEAQEIPTVKDFLKTATVKKRPNAILRIRRTEEFVMFVSQY